MGAAQDRPRLHRWLVLDSADEHGELFLFGAGSDGPFHVYGFVGDPRRLPDRILPEGPLDDFLTARYVMYRVADQLARQGFRASQRQPVWRLHAYSAAARGGRSA